MAPHLPPSPEEDCQRLNARVLYPRVEQVQLGALGGEDIEGQRPLQNDVATPHGKDSRVEAHLEGEGRAGVEEIRP
jgi:hypothetical protein